MTDRWWWSGSDECFLCLWTETSCVRVKFVFLTALHLSKVKVPKEKKNLHNSGLHFILLSLFCHCLSDIIVLQSQGLQVWFVLESHLQQFLFTSLNNILCPFSPLSSCLCSLYPCFTLSAGPYSFMHIVVSTLVLNLK